MEENSRALTIGTVPDLCSEPEKNNKKNLRGNSVPPQARCTGLPDTNLTAEASLSVYETKGWTEQKLEKKRITGMTEDTMSMQSLYP